MASEPEYRNGKICYIEIPAISIAESAAFYSTVFGWEINQRSDGSTTFNDTVGQVSGTWVLGISPSTQIGILISIMVFDAEATIKLITDNGGTIIEGIGRHLPEITARFSDPAGNIWAIYQQHV